MFFVIHVIILQPFSIYFINILEKLVYGNTNFNLCVLEKLQLMFLQY